MKPRRVERIIVKRSIAKDGVMRPMPTLRQRAPSDRIVLLDATRVANGPAGRNSGFMIDLPHDLASGEYAGGLEADQRRTRLSRAGIDFAADAAGEYRLGVEVFDRRGKINAAATAKDLAHNAAYSKHLTTIGEPHAIRRGRDAVAYWDRLLQGRAFHSRSGYDPAGGVRSMRRARAGI